VVRLLTALAVLALGLVPAVGQAPVAAADVQVAVSAPANGATLAGPNVTVNFQVSGLNVVTTNVPLTEAGARPGANHTGEGHVHFMLDTQPLVVWDHTGPYTFQNVPPGEHQLMVEAVQNDHGGFDPPVAQTIRFRTTALLGATGAGPAPSRLSGGVLLLGAASLAVGGVLTWQTRRRRGPAAAPRS
jgi:hypothetical protein